MRSVALLARRCRRGRPGARDRRHRAARRPTADVRGFMDAVARCSPDRLQPLRLPDHLRRRLGGASRRRRPATASGRVLRAADSLSTLARDARDRRETLPTRSPSATRELEEQRALAARRAVVRDARPRAAGGGVRRPDALPARPRPDRPLEGVPAPQGQDAGVHRPRRRPLPHAHDAHARDDRDLARRRARAAAERGPRRGDRPRPRHGPHAVRARGRGRARRGAARALRPAVPPQRAVASRSPGGSTSRTRSATASSRTPASASRRRSRGRSSASSTASRTSTTTSTTRSASGSSPRPTCRATRSSCSARPAAKRIDTLVHDLVETSEEAGDIRQSTRSARRCSRCGRSCSSASTSARRSSPSTAGRAR